MQWGEKAGLESGLNRCSNVWILPDSSHSNCPGFSFEPCLPRWAKLSRSNKNINLSLYQHVTPQILGFFLRTSIISFYFVSWLPLCLGKVDQNFGVSLLSADGSRSSRKWRRKKKRLSLLDCKAMSDKILLSCNSKEV